MRFLSNFNSATQGEVDSRHRDFRREGGKGGTVEPNEGPGVRWVLGS